MKRLVLILAPLALLVAPQPAASHSLVRPAGGVISYLSEDATSLNTLTVSVAGTKIDLRDPTVDGGIDPGTCEAGDVAGGFIVQVLCPGAGVSRLRIDLGEREDAATVSAPVPSSIAGGPGADTLTGGPAGDEILGGDGNDLLDAAAGDDIVDGGLGADSLGGGPGADRLISRDGIADVVVCGDGADEVDADTLDEVGGDCEQVTVTFTEPPSGYVLDKPGPPAVEAGAETVQRLKRDRRVRVFATSSEVGTVSASGFLEFAGLSLPLTTESRPVAVGGAGAAITYRLSREHYRRASRALEAGRRVRVALSVVATDLAGSSSEAPTPTIRLTARRAAGKSAGGLHQARRHPELGDVDGDGIGDSDDNCPFAANGSQINTDAGLPGGDVQGDACDDDDDADGVTDASDNCRVSPNLDQSDSDGDGYGDACPPVDTDGDGLIDDNDNCDLVSNPGQQDLDGDDRGDVCDFDDDGDGFDDGFDNCPTVYNLEPTDVDGDGQIYDQLDADGDGIGTACDADDSTAGPPAGPDTVAPQAEVRAARRQRLAQLGAGMIVRLRCSEACRASAELVVRRADARGLRDDRVAATGSARLDGAGATFAFVRLERRARRVLRRAGAVHAALVTEVADSSGNTVRSSRPLIVSGRPGG